MIPDRKRNSVRSGAPLASAVAAVLCAAAAMPAAAQQGLEEIVVTAQRRETALQTTPIAISAFSGEMLAADKLFSVGDLANSVAAFSLTANTPLDLELNIRGITNTRLDSPTSDPSVGTFVDGVYIGRTGDYNFDFYDLERIEVIRGPQGVLLGKNVVGGALSIITASPDFENSGQVLASYGNYNSMLLSGYLTGGLTDTLAGRFSFQGRKHDGYAEDILHNRDVEDLESLQFRAQLLWEPGDSGWRVRGIFDYTTDDSNGVNVVAVDGGEPGCETSYLRNNCSRPWSNLRAYLGITDPRKNIAQSIEYKGQPRVQQFLERDGYGLTLDIEKEFSGVTFNSLTGYRTTDSAQLYDQTGAGPEALGWSVAEWQKYIAFINAKFGPRSPASNQGAFLFAQPVGEAVEADAFSQEFRFTSNNEDSRIDWIAGAYLKIDNVDKSDAFIGENFLGATVVAPGGTNGLSTLSGESRWVNEGEVTNYAGFAQLGFKFTEGLKLSVGLRYTNDEKEGTIDALVVETGDRFNPNDPRANVTIESICRSPAGAVVPTPAPGVCAAPNKWTYGEGEGFTTKYSEEWSETTPQAILEWTVNDALFVYATYSEGFKGGGFDDTPANIPQATTPFDPEKATNYELGVKANLLDRTLRLNAAVFNMDYENLQVTQTNAACLCNLTDNAASASIKGFEAELEYAAMDNLRLTLAGSYVDATYEDFLESATIPGTNPPQRLDSSGNRLQRTPETQVTGGIDLTSSLGQWEDALNLRVTVSWQSDMFWATDNIATEDAYALLDARLGLAPAGVPWEVAVWGKNLTDELYRRNIIHFFGEEVSQYGTPRTYGLDFTWKF